MWLTLPVFSLIAGGLVLTATQYGGIGTSPDSISFIAASKSLLNGDGYRRFTGLPFNSWPPLYPTILAGLHWITRPLNIDLVEAIRYFHAFVLGATVFTAGVLARRMIKAWPLVVMAWLFILFSYALITIASLAWTEPIYILLSLIYLFILPRFLAKRRPVYFVLLFGIVTLGALQRYAGIGIIVAAVGSIVLFMKGTPFLKRAAWAAGLSLSVVPYGLWYLSNRLSETSIRDQTNPIPSLLRNFRLTIDLLGEWFVPEVVRTPAVSLLVTWLIAAAVIWAFVSYFRRQEQTFLSNPIALVAAYVVFYMLAFYVSHLLISTTPVDHRHLSVIYIHIIILVFAAVENLLQRLNRPHWQSIAVGAAALCLLQPVSSSVFQVNLLSQWCCRGNEYRQMDVIQWLNTHKVDGQLYSNTPIPLFHTPFMIYAAPRLLDGWLNQSADQPVYLIWFYDVAQYDGSPRFYYDLEYTEDDLSAIRRVETVEEFHAATILRLTRP